MNAQDCSGCPWFKSPNCSLPDENTCPRAEVRNSYRIRAVSARDTALAALVAERDLLRTALAESARLRAALGSICPGCVWWQLPGTERSVSCLSEKCRALAVAAEDAPRLTPKQVNTAVAHATDGAEDLEVALRQTFQPPGGGGIVLDAAQAHPDLVDPCVTPAAPETTEPPLGTEMEPGYAPVTDCWTCIHGVPPEGGFGVVCRQPHHPGYTSEAKELGRARNEAVRERDELRAVVRECGRLLAAALPAEPGSARACYETLRTALAGPPDPLDW